MKAGEFVNKKKVVPEPNEALRRYREAWRNFVLAQAKKLQEKEQKSAS
jgi:hypothetical protein